MKVEALLTALHINSYFLSNKIHYNFYRKIKEQRGDQFLIPVYTHFKEKDIADVPIDYVFNSLDKRVFVTKIFKVLWLYSIKKFSHYDYLHGHTLISDGIPTYLLAKKMDKPFVVSVRNTDINLFILRSWIFKKIGGEILNEAKAIFFISPSIQKKIYSIYPALDKKKANLLPNCLDPFWESQERHRRRAPTTSTIKLLFVGEIIPRKNLDILLRFVNRKSERAYKLTVVGKNTSGVDFEEAKKFCAGENEINYLGEINNKKSLKEIYDSHDIFVLLSKSETFGVVYIEALSRGLPIVYSKDEGMDGFFHHGEVGFPCKIDSLDDLESAIDRILSNYDVISESAYKYSSAFHWDKNIKNYISVVDKCI